MAKHKTVVITAEELIARRAAASAASADLLTARQIAEQAIANQAKTEKVVEELKKTYSPVQAQEALATCLGKYGVDPADELVRMALEQDDTGKFILTADQRIGIWKELLSYRLPKLKSAQMAGQIDQSLTVIVKRFGENGQLVADQPLNTFADNGNIIEVKKLN